MHIWLVGAGPMSKDYAKVLTAQGVDTTVIGRSEASASSFEEATGLPVVRGGLARLLNEAPQLPDAAIVAVGVEELAETTSQLVDAGVRRILCEKPGGLDAAQIRDLAAHAEGAGTEVLLGYNRRFYASVEAAREAIEQDGGASSFSFEFTEWGHVIAARPRPEAILRSWFLANSTHVMDTAFHLAGDPKHLTALVSGGLSWHPDGAAYAGCGTSAGGALFSYQANWAAPGRWGVEVCTPSRRFILRPMEKLQVQELGSVTIAPIELDDHLDTTYKPGLYRQVAHFLAGETGLFRSLEDQAKLMDVYETMQRGGAFVSP